MNQVDTIFVFTDAATSPQAGVSVGIFLCLEKRDIDIFKELSIKQLSNELADKVSYKKYKSNKSTWSEIKTIIHALHSIQIKFEQSIQRIEIYTDCQTICDLLGWRKEKLEKNNFLTKSGCMLQHAALYKELYFLTNKFQVQTFKIKGHQSKSQLMTWQEKIFYVVDKLSRKKMRSNDRIFLTSQSHKISTGQA